MINPAFTVSDFVAVFNQTIDYVYPSVTIVGELANYRVSKGKWVYFDLKDDTATVRFFGSIYILPGPLEDGMMVQVVGSPKLHQTFGFSITVKSIVPVGEGSIKKATALLQAKLTKEGLFDEARKRSLPYPPTRIGLIASAESAAYKDFIKVLAARWGGIEILHVDTQVQGEAAPKQIVDAIGTLNNMDAVDIIVVTRGGGSSDDLQAFSNELVVRAVATSRTPTLIAIGHETDLSLAELASDKRASTPSNAAELIVPDREATILQLETELKNSYNHIINQIYSKKEAIHKQKLNLDHSLFKILSDQLHYVQTVKQILIGYDPRQVLKRGYAVVRHGSSHVTSVNQLKPEDKLSIRLIDGIIHTRVTSLEREAK